MQIRDSLGAAAGRARDEAAGLTEAFLDPALWLDMAGRALRVAAILALALVALAVLRRFRMRAVRRVRELPPHDPRRQRTLTVTELFGSTARYLVWGVATIMVLAEIGLNVGPLLAGAGVAGLAIGFGAQTLVKDVISGVFLLFDDTLHIGDSITHGSHTGEVEYIGLRLIKIRTFDGELVMIPAGELRTFGNRSRGFARAIIDVPLPAGRPLDEVLAGLEEAAAEWAAEPENRATMLDDAPDVQGIVSSGTTPVARVVVRVRPDAAGRTERELLRRITRRLSQA